MTAESISKLVSSNYPDLKSYESLYKHFHTNPELSNQEFKTAETIYNHLQKISSDFTIKSKIGGTGIVAILHNGQGSTILLRADFDALPVLERTGLDYASKTRMRNADGVEVPVMHACGHDVHITGLLAAAELLVSVKSHWSGTLVLAFQPAEERGTGAQAMVDDGMYDPDRHAVPKPDVCIGGHVSPYRAGLVGTRRGVIASSADSMRVTLHGRGGHASMPHKLVDPVVMAASTVMKLQTIVSREVDAAEHAVVTVASIQAGDAENIVVDDAHLAVDIRAMSASTRKQVNDAVRRVINAEALSSAAVSEPTITPTRSFPLTYNDPDCTARLEDAFAVYFGEGGKDSKGSKEGREYRRNIPPFGASEDFSILASAINRPSVFFMYGGTDHGTYDQAEKEGKLGSLPQNHSGLFAPSLQPTLTVGMECYAVAALAWLAKEKGKD